MKTAASVCRMLAAVLFSASPVAAQMWSIGNVTVVDVEHGYLIPGVSVTILRDRIVAVGAVKGPVLVNGGGQFLMPGLWDMHSATQLDAGVAGAYLAHGVTGVRDMGAADLNRTLALYRDIEAGRVAGPRILTGGPGVRAATPDQARAAFDRMFETDADFIRFHKDLDYESYIALAERSRKWRYPFAGPMPPSVRLRDVLELRQSSVEGLARLDRLTREEACAGYSAASAAGTWFTPMLASHRGRKAAAMVQLMRECRAPLLAGGGVVDELEALVELAGFPPQEALRAATSEPARFLGRADQLGAVAAGRFADLILLDANPLEDIANLRRVAGVVARGRYFAREALTALRHPPSTIKGWPPQSPQPPPNALGSAPRNPAASSARPPVSSAKPVSRTP